jgi:ferredoxin
MGPARWHVGAHRFEESKRMKVIVDFEICQSHGLCMQAAPEVFELRDDGFLYVLQEEPAESLRKKVEIAVRECPTGAIKLEG